MKNSKPVLSDFVISEYWRWRRIVFGDIRDGNKSNKPQGQRKD